MTDDRSKGTKAVQATSARAGHGFRHISRQKRFRRSPLKLDARPPSKFVDVIAWIDLKNKRVLCTRTRGKKIFYLPGGKREPGESDAEALCRKIYEELTVVLAKETLSEMTTVEEIAHGYAKPTQVRMQYFQADYSGEIFPSGEIEEIAWLNYADLDWCAPAA